MSGMLKKWIKIFSEGISGFANRIYIRISTRLSTRLLFTLTLLSALPLIVVGVFLTSVTRESLLEYVKSQHVEIARRANNEIKLFLETPIKTLQILKETQDIAEMNPFAQGLILNKIRSADPIFNKIIIVDTLGHLVTSSAFEEQITDYQQDEFYNVSAQGQSYFSNVMFNEGKEPYVISSHSIKRFDEIVGILAGDINLTTIWALVDSINVGQTGSAFVISKSGQLIAHPDKRKILERVSVIDSSLISNISDSTETSVIFSSSEDVEMLGTFSYLKPFDWIVVIQQPIGESYGVAANMLYQVFAFVGLVIMIAVLLSYLLEKRITQPINQLVDGVKRYAEGDLDY